MTSKFTQKRQWKHQPIGPSEIDFSHPLAQGLELFLVPIGDRVIDLVNPDQVWTPAGAAVVHSSEVGLVANFSGAAGTQFTSTGYERVVGVGTMFLWARWIATFSANGHIYLSDNSSVYFQAGYGGTAPSQVFYIGATSKTGSWPDSPFSRDNTSLVFTGKGTTVFMNGALAATPGGVDGVAFAAGSKTLNFGRHTAGDSWNTRAEIIALGWTSEAWTDAEAAAWHANPWQFVRRRRVIPRSSAAPAVTVRPQIFIMT